MTTTKNKGVRRQKLAVKWLDQTWKPPIARPAVRRNPALNTELRTAGKPPRTNTLRSYRVRGFTLIELLVVISIIAILAAMLMPAISRVKLRAQIGQAQTDMSNIETAISGYHAEYSRYPSSAAAANSVNPNWPDFTFGTVHPNGEVLRDREGVELPPIANAGNTPRYQASNAELMAILLNVEYFGNTPTVNTNFDRNPRKLGFLNAKQVSGITSPGVGEDGVFRDPWGTPYIITVDMDSNGKTRDAYYRLQAVSQESGMTGFNGLSRHPTNAVNTFEANREVMIWSFGRDRQVEMNPEKKANEGANKDNVLSWK